MTFVSIIKLVLTFWRNKTNSEEMIGSKKVTKAESQDASESASAYFETPKFHNTHDPTSGQTSDKLHANLTSKATTAVGS
jgi:hypothetical protein